MRRGHRPAAVRRGCTVSIETVPAELACMGVIGGVGLRNFVLPRCPLTNGCELVITAAAWERDCARRRRRNISVMGQHGSNGNMGVAFGLEPMDRWCATACTGAVPAEVLLVGPEYFQPRPSVAEAASCREKKNNTEGAMGLPLAKRDTEKTACECCGRKRRSERKTVHGLFLCSGCEHLSISVVNRPQAVWWMLDRFGVAPPHPAPAGELESPAGAVYGQDARELLERSLAEARERAERAEGAAEALAAQLASVQVSLADAHADASACRDVLNDITATKWTDQSGVPQGYEVLDDVLRQAMDQAAIGKGRERHADAGVNFEDQAICAIARDVGCGFPMGQAIKKIRESTRLPSWPRARAELLGAINYLAAAVIVGDERRLPADEE